MGSGRPRSRSERRARYRTPVGKAMVLVLVLVPVPVPGLEPAMERRRWRRRPGRERPVDTRTMSQVTFRFHKCVGLFFVILREEKIIYILTA